jgi:hypothetical protein
MFSSILPFCLTRRDYYYKRAILCLSSSKILGGRTHSPGGEGGGGSIFWKTRDIGLPSYSNNLSILSHPMHAPFRHFFLFEGIYGCELHGKWKYRRVGGNCAVAVARSPRAFLYFKLSSLRRHQTNTVVSTPTALYLHRLMTRSACPPGLAGSRLYHAWWRKNR